MTRSALAVACALLVAGCSTSNSTGATSGDASTFDSGAACAFPAFDLDGGTCPADCLTVSASEVDKSRQCVQPVSLGCLACPNGCGGAPEPLVCYTHVADGRSLRVPTYAIENDPHGAQAWTTCSAEEAARFDAPLCATR